MRRILYFLIFQSLLLISCQQKTEIVPGTSLALAQERKNAINQLRYHLSFDIPETSGDSIPAHAEIHFDITAVPGVLQFDFKADPSRVKRVQVNNRAVSIRIEQEHLLIDGDDLKKEGNVVRVDFMAGDAALNRNAEYLYTLFVPSRASTCFPVFDQPDLKAVYLLQLKIPHNWEAVSNGKLVSAAPEGDRKLLTFSETKPISSYQFAFAAGKFRKATDSVSGMTMYYRETDTVKVFKNLSRIFELHRQSIDWLQNYTGISYPFEKFDFALMPAFQFGGMEHPGSIFYRESSIILDPSASVNDELRRASLIAHETAHMWFGNLVTMQWFNDVWLKEVFANFMAAKIVNPGFPKVNHDLRFLMAHYPAALEIDRSGGSHPIQQPLDNLRNAGSIYGAIIYQKAPIMMRNLETLMGEENFQKGLQDYLHSYAYGNATWDDLVASLSKFTKKDLTVWNKAWIKTAGMPEVRYDYAADAGLLIIANSGDTSQIVWPQSFRYLLQTSDGKDIRDVEISSGDRVDLPLNSRLLHIIPNYGGRGYGFFPADSADLAFLLSEAGRLEDPSARAAVWMNLWEHFLRGRLDGSKLLDKLLASVAAESDPLLMEYLTDKVTRLYWQFMTPEQRGLATQRIEETFFERMAVEHDNSLKRAVYNAYVRIAMSKQGIANMVKFWKNEITLGLDLSERDHIQLAYELTLRQAEGYESILRQQLEKAKNPDRKAEISFILPALSADPAVRDQFFESLRKQENRTREPWVLQAVRLLHHPLRGAQSEKYIPESLKMLEELKQTGDIFFPKGWLDATLGEYQSASAAKSVRTFLEERKDLPQDLRNKLLQSADMMFRAESITNSSVIE